MELEKAKLEVNNPKTNITKINNAEYINSHWPKIISTFMARANISDINELNTAKTIKAKLLIDLAYKQSIKNIQIKCHENQPNKYSRGSK